MCINLKGLIPISQDQTKRGGCIASDDLEVFAEEVVRKAGDSGWGVV
jgi:hypothetical protein